MSTNFDICSYITGKPAGFVAPSNRGNVEAVQSADENFDEVMCRAQAAQSFKEYYRHNLSELKYEMKMHQSRLLHFLSSRGERRLLEKRKYKCIGEINSLTKILDEVKINQRIIEKEELNRPQTPLSKGSNTNKAIETLMLTS